MTRSKGWESVREHGYLNRTQVREIMKRSIAGLVTFHDLPNHVDAQPNKMFEYMSAGLPVICSDFPLWRSIVEGSSCGICVDPLNVDATPMRLGVLLQSLRGQGKWVRTVEAQ